MSKTETMTCDECFGRYKPETCPKCNGTGIVTTGKILGTLPSTPDPVTDEPDEPTITTTQGDAPSVVTGNGLRYVYAPGHDSGATVTDERDATIAEQAAEIEKLKQSCTGFLRSIASQETDINHRDARINEQAAEIERLRGELNEKGEALTMAEMSLMETDEEVKGLRADRDNWKKLFTDHLAVESQLRAKLAEATLIDAPELRTERDTLRLENQRLKDLSFEAQDRYAAIEAERDALKAKLKDAETVATLAADRKRLLGEANARAEKYLAVIAAQSDMIEAQERHNEISLRLSQAYSVAGFATDVLQVGDVPRVKEADRD